MYFLAGVNQATGSGATPLCSYWQSDRVPNLRLFGIATRNHNSLVAVSYLCFIRRQVASRDANRLLSHEHCGQEK